LELSLDARPNTGSRKSLKPIKVNEVFTSVNFPDGARHARECNSGQKVALRLEPEGQKAGLLYCGATDAVSECGIAEQSYAQQKMPAWVGGHCFQSGCGFAAQIRR
jgi:hypothetical protein